MTQTPSGSSFQSSTDMTDPAFESLQTADQSLTNGSLATSPRYEMSYRGQKVKSAHTSDVGWEDTGIVSPAQKRGLRPWWQGLSVKTKVTALAVILGTTPVIAIGAIAYQLANQSITEQIKQSERNRATQLANEVNLFMTDRFSDVQVLGQSPLFSNPKVFAASSAEDRAALLDRYLSLYGVYANIAVFNLNGDTVAQSTGNPVPNHANEPFFQQVLKTEKPTITTPQIAKATKKLAIKLAAPIKDTSTGKLVGVTRFLLPVAGMEKFTKGYETAQDDVYLVDNSGNYFLASGNNRRVGKPAAEHFAKYAQLQENQESGSAIDVDPDNGSQRLLTYVPLKNLAGLPEQGFGILIASNTNTAFASQRQLLITIALGTAAAAILVAAIAAILANRATRPILSAANAVGKIGRGELDTRLVFEGNDEIASLGNNINTMAIQLQESLDVLTFEAAQERILTTAKGSGVMHPSDLKTVFDQVVHAAHDLLKPDRLVLYQLNRGTKGGIISEAVSPGWSSAIKQNVSDSCISEDTCDAYVQGRIVVANDVTQAGFGAAHLELLRSLEVKASLIVPVIVSGQPFGLLIAHHCATPYKWQDNEIEFLKRLGSELGLSIYRVELLQQTTELAEEQRQIKEGIQRRALELLQEVDPISQGDLTTRAKVTADEIGTIADSYNATVNNLRQIILQVQEAASQVTTTTNVSETSVQTLTAEALRQAEEISSALEVVRDMATTAQMVAINAEKAKATVEQANQTVAAGDAAMNRTVDGIQAIRSTVAETAKKVKHLGESSQRISNVVDLIGAFAAQTNMLALNASIEASRAGEEGRGFAVVADEVRTLARQSAEATEEIRKLVFSIQSETNEVMTAMEAGTEQVVIGTKLVDETRQNLTKITTASSQISDLVTAIAQATIAQSKASETVSQTMKDVAAIADKTSTEANQVSSSFKRLQTVAKTLQEGVSRFKVN